MADPFPLYLPPEARRLFQSESLLRRLAQNAHWSSTSRLLEVHGSLGGLALARALNCTLTVLEPDARAAETLQERAKLAGITDKITFVQQSVASASFPIGSFDGIFSLGRVAGSLTNVATQWRPWLAERGRLATTWVMKVSRNPAPAALDAWNARIGEPLKIVRECLISLETMGFEPEMVESLGDADLEEYYRELELVLAKAANAEGAAVLRDEIAVHRAQNGRAGITYAAIVARRKEPGEKPPISRDAG